MKTRVAAAALAAAALASCGRKDQTPSPPPASQPPPSLAVTTTTLPPPPTTVPTPPPVWRSARWGMTREEVLAAFKGDAQRLPTPVPFTQPQPGSSVPAGSSDVAIPAHDEESTRFRVLFGFGAAGLERIHFSSAKAGAATCGDLEKRFSDLHSRPTQRVSTGTSLKGEEMVWKLPDQTIVLRCAGVASLGFQTVALDYLAPTVALAAAH